MTDSFKHKMQQWAPKPPDDVWDAIEARLDEQSAFAQKLYEFEAAPPDVWQKIEAQLPAASNEGALVRKIRWTKWAVAAAVLFVAVTSYYFFNPKTEITPITTASSVLPVPKQEQTNSQPAQNIIEQPVQMSSTQTITAIPQTTNNAAEMPQHRQPAFSRLKHLAMEEEETAIVSTAFMPDHIESTHTITFSDLVEKYMVYSDDNGNAMRVPRQLFEYISCIKDEITCKQKKALLQAQLASTTLSTDFTGVLEMLSHLKENQ